MKLLLLLIPILFTACANVDTIEPESATIQFYFAPEADMETTFTNTNGVTWTIESASMLAGEIGIHWDREVTTRSGESIVQPRHDVSGKISPKIYGYYAVDLLDSTPIQELIVDPKHYDHIHMVLIPADSITTADSAKGISAIPELKSNSVVISGTVTNGTETKKFTYIDRRSYGENDLGDILIDLSVYEGDRYAVYVHPDFQSWFDNIKWNYLSDGDEITISDSENMVAYLNIESTFAADNAMNYTFSKK